MLRIAIVEDNPADAQILQRAIEETGEPVQVTVIGDGLEAVQRITGGNVECDLVLLDLNLPRLNGFEVLERLRSHDCCKSLPVVVVSGSRDPAEIERCYRSGANSYVSKPIHLDEIFLTASQLVTYWSKCAKLPTALKTARA